MRSGERVVVVGGGIAGLTAALRLASGGGEAVGNEEGGPEVVLLEADADLGGKIRPLVVGGVEVEAGPDAFLARRPEAVALAREVGLGDDLLSPSISRAYVWSRGALRTLPDGLVLGVPGRLDTVLRSGILSPGGVARAALDLVRPATSVDGDVSVGELVRRRFGREVDERLVDPLLGGINAGATLHLSAAASAPQLLSVARSSRSLLRGLRAQQRAAAGAPPTGPAAPVFLTPRGGLTRLVDAVAAAARRHGADLRTGVAVTGLRRYGAGAWELATSAGPLRAHHVVVATPAFAAADLLAAVAPDAAAGLAAIEYAGVALVTFAWPSVEVGIPLDASGFLIPRVEDRLVTACTWTSSKWAHTARPGQVIFRASVGRHGDERWAAMDDATLVRHVVHDLRPIMALTGDAAEVVVTRWPRSFPQYDVGHLDRIDAIERSLATAAPGITLAGAALRGVGIPATIGSGTAAAARPSSAVP